MAGYTAGEACMGRALYLAGRQDAARSPQERQADPRRHPARLHATVARRSSKRKRFASKTGEEWTSAC